MNLPPDDGQSVLRFIVGEFATKRIKPGQPTTYLTYGEVLDRLHLSRDWANKETHGDALSRQGLWSLANWTKDESHPAITGLVVNQSFPHKPRFCLTGGSSP